LGIYASFRTIYMTRSSLGGGGGNIGIGHRPKVTHGGSKFS